MLKNDQTLSQEVIDIYLSDWSYDENEHMELFLKNTK